MDKDMLANELYLMGKGVRDCCETTIGGTPAEIDEILYDIEAMCLDYKYQVLSFLLEKEEDREYRAVFICKYNFQKILLTKLFNEIKPHSFEYEYMMGTLLGYSAASMEEFLMRKCTDEFASITEYDAEEGKEEASPIKNQLSEFDKDAWQVLMYLNNNCTPDSEKINMLTDLLYTETGDSREKNLIHNLSVAMPDVNKPDFSPCIKVLERYFHVDSEDKEPDTSSAETAKMDPNIKQYFGRAAGLYAFLTMRSFTEDYKLDHIKKFIDITPPQSFSEFVLYDDIKSAYHDKTLSQEKKIEATKHAIHTYLVHIKNMENSKTNESIDPYRQAVSKLYSDLLYANTEKEFVSILNKFLEKDACYKVHKNFQQCLQWIIENKYGKAHLSLTRCYIE